MPNRPCNDESYHDESFMLRSYLITGSLAPLSPVSRITRALSRHVMTHAPVLTVTHVSTAGAPRARGTGSVTVDTPPT